MCCGDNRIIAPLYFRTLKEFKEIGFTRPQKASSYVFFFFLCMSGHTEGGK